MNILKDFYYGTLHPIEKIIPLNTEYRFLFQDINNKREYFAEQLSTKDKEYFEKWNQQIKQYEEIFEYANFSYGFKLGTMLAFEIFSEKENQ